MITLTRAETPTQSPLGELKRAGVRSRLAASTGRRSPLSCRYSRAGEFSVKITSAGDLDPSATISAVEDVLVVVADRDLDPGRLFEGGYDRLGRLDVLAVVERDGHVPTSARRRPARTGGNTNRHHGDGREPRQATHQPVQYASAAKSASSKIVIPSRASDSLTLQGGTACNRLNWVNGSRPRSLQARIRSAMAGLVPP